MHAGVPWAISHVGTRYGWSEAGPAVWNLLGLVPAAFGTLVLLWVMLFGFTQLRNVPERVPVDWRPALLMTGGPYAFSRNPIYVGELAMWIGWAILYGSVPVFIVFALLLAGVRHMAVREEATMEATFGDTYRQYKIRVPRWIGLPRLR